MQLTPRRRAVVAITIQFLALVRTLLEIYRLRAVAHVSFGLNEALPYVNGALMAAVGAWIAVICFMRERYSLAVGVVLATIVVMLVYKVAFVG